MNDYNRPNNGDTDSTRTRALRRGWTLDQRVDALLDLVEGVREDVTKIREEQKAVAKELADGKTRSELFELRINNLEKIVYGICTMFGISVVGALITLIIRTSPGSNPAP